MKLISSKDNPSYKDVLKLTKRKYRDQSSRYILEGVKPLRDAIRLDIGVEKVFIQERRADDLDQDDVIKHQNWVILDDKLFEEVSSTENSQGIIAVVRKNEYSVEEFFHKIDESPRKSVVIIDRLQDPGNLGTIIRTAEAAGYGGVILLSGSVDPYSQKVVRSTAGSLFRVPVLNLKSAEECISLIKEHKLVLTVTCLENAVSSYEANLGENIALVIGNEGSGVSQEMIDSADIRIKIPMAGSIESLNAAVAAGILMYQNCVL